jgi:hypothetical protein
VHIGLITSRSGFADDWRYVKFKWRGDEPAQLPGGFAEGPGSLTGDPGERAPGSGHGPHPPEALPGPQSNLYPHQSCLLICQPLQPPPSRPELRPPRRS